MANGSEDVNKELSLKSNYDSSERVQFAPSIEDGTSSSTDYIDLIKHLRFSPSEGRIWFDTHPVVLIRPASLSLLHWELNKKLGHQEAGAILAQLGYESGAREAILAQKLLPNASLEEIFLVGPQLRAIRGLVSMRTLHQEINLASNHFYNETLFSGDFEVDTRVVEDGMANSPVCWNEVAYASGYASTLLQRPVIYKEVECSATGSHKCRMVGKLLEMWFEDEIKLELTHLPGTLKGEYAPTKRKTHFQAKQYVFERDRNEPNILGDLIGQSPKLNDVCSMIKKVAGTSVPVLLLGETGVGKEMIAKTLHQFSQCAEQPFIAVNCAAIPDDLIEAELFGVSKGAFTGATQSRPGRFERAHGGTLFLDEVGNLTKSAQTKLLRAVQEKEIERVGDTFMRKVDVRIIAATNENLEDAVKAGRFREDLLFRLNVFPLEIPALRERRDDIPLLMAHFLKRYNERYERNIPGFTDVATEALYHYNYPGNIRELENLVERTVILADDHQAIDLCHLFGTEGLINSAASSRDHCNHATEHSGQDSTEAMCSELLDMMLSKKTPFKQIEHRLLKNALGKANNNMTKAADFVGLSRPQMAYRLKKHGTE